MLHYLHDAPLQGSQPMTSRKSKTSSSPPVGAPTPAVWPTSAEAWSGPITAKLFKAADANSGITVSFAEAYGDYMENHVRPYPIEARQGEEHRDCRLRDYKLIRCVSARPVFVPMWKNSAPYLRDFAAVYGVDPATVVRPPLSVADLTMSIWQAEHERRKEAAEATGGGAYIDEQQILTLMLEAGANYVPAPPEKQHSYGVFVKRFADAMVTFGLLEPHPPKTKTRYLNGTERLHQLMLRIEGASFCAVKESRDDA